MARTLFFGMVLRKFSEVTNNKPIFSQYNIFYNYKYFFFQSAFWSLFNHRQRSQSNQEQCSLFSPCFVVLLCTHYGPLQCFSTYFCKLKKVGSFTTHISKLCYFLWLWFNFVFSSFSKQDHLLTFFCESMPKGALNVHVFQRRNWCNPKSDRYPWYVKKQSAK